jgi:3-deoxy-D-manno-octulosonic-acid transferase
MISFAKELAPSYALVISTTTETGLAEAKRSLPEAQDHFLLPLDFSWTIRALLRNLSPSYLILCESDFWWNLLTLTHKLGIPIFLINGKISKRSTERFRFFSRFARPLFSCFDQMCVQNEEYYQRFLSLGISQEKLCITGNLKLDVEIPPEENPEQLRERLSLSPSDLILVIGSTHEPEEAELLSALAPLWERWKALKILLVPRHPERFSSVAELLKRQGIPFTRYSAPTPGARLILIDTMGQLGACYSLAHLAIVAGSYTPRIGGHNIFEPIQRGVPVFFGPYMHSQQELEQLVLAAGAGRQVPLTSLSDAVDTFFSSSEGYTAACARLSASVRGATRRTLERCFARKN